VASEPHALLAGQRLRVWGMTALLYCVAAGVPMLVSAPWSRRWVKATLAGSMAIPLMIVTFLLPSLVSAAIATHLHYRMHPSGFCAGTPHGVRPHSVRCRFRGRRNARGRPELGRVTTATSYWRSDEAAEQADAADEAQGGTRTAS
jgi:hypothetical protein